MEQLELFIQEHMWLVVLVAFWSIPWKGYALWNAAQRGHRNWFIILLVSNTLAILDIIYIFFVAKKHTHSQEQNDAEDGSNPSS